MMKGNSQYSRPTTAKKPPMASPRYHSKPESGRVKTEMRGEDYQALVQQM